MRGTPIRQNRLDRKSRGRPPFSGSRASAPAIMRKTGTDHRLKESMTFAVHHDGVPWSVKRRPTVSAIVWIAMTAMIAAERVGFIHCVDRGGGPVSSTRSNRAMEDILPGFALRHPFG